VSLVISGISALTTDIIVMVTRGSKHHERSNMENLLVTIMGCIRQAANLTTLVSIVYILNRFSKEKRKNVSEILE